MSEVKPSRDVSILNRSLPWYPKPTKRQSSDYEIQASSINFEDVDASRQFLRQMHYYNQIKYKLNTDKSFLPKIKTALNSSGTSLANTSLRQISQTCISPIHKKQIATSKSLRRQKNSSLRSKEIRTEDSISKLSKQSKRSKKYEVDQLNLTMPSQNTNQGDIPIIDSASIEQQNEEFLTIIKNNPSVILPQIPKNDKLSIEIQSAYQQPQFEILETPIMSLMKSVHYVEMKKQGVDIRQPIRDPVIPPGMPGSSCQMHSQINNEILKNLQRRKYIETSESAQLNKWRFKMHQEKQDDQQLNHFDRTCQVIELEQQMMKSHRISENKKISPQLEQFLTCSLTKNQKSRYSSSGQGGGKGDKSIDKMRVNRLQQVQREYEARKLTEKLQSSVGDELVKNEIIKMAEKQEKITVIDNGLTKKEIKSVFTQGSPVYKYQGILEQYQKQKAEYEIVKKRNAALAAAAAAAANPSPDSTLKKPLNQYRR